MLDISLFLQQVVVFRVQDDALNVKIRTRIVHLLRARANNRRIQQLLVGMELGFEGGEDLLLLVVESERHFE